MTDQAPELLPSETALSMECELKHYRLQDGAMVESRVINSHNTFVKSADVRQALVAALTRPVPVAGETLRRALERLRDNGLEEALPSPQTKNPFPNLADLEAYWCQRFAAMDARVRNIASAALRSPTLATESDCRH